MKGTEITDCVWINEKLHIALLKKNDPSKFVKFFRRVTSLLRRRKGGL